MTKPKMLKLAWQLATGIIGSGDHIAEAHKLVSHADDSECDGGATCGIDRDGLLAYELAHEIAAMQGARFAHFVMAWIDRSVERNSRSC